MHALEAIVTRIYLESGAKPHTTRNFSRSIRFTVSSHDHGRRADSLSRRRRRYMITADAQTQIRPSELDSDS